MITISPGDIVSLFSDPTLTNETTFATFLILSAAAMAGKLIKCGGQYLTIKV